MSFEPIKYAWDAMGLWHLLIFALILSPVVMSMATGNVEANAPVRSLPSLLAFTGLLFSFYLLIAPVVGQIFGDKYSFAQVWPSSLFLGVMFSVFFVTLVATAEWQRFTAELGGFLAVAFFFFAAFLGLAFNMFLWLMPRMVGFGVIEMPKYSWGVQL